ncbi:hypothetical protein MMC29_006809 [Sticta canariensis]|nr:hypothetical protein [Sticta canariensis]
MMKESEFPLDHYVSGLYHDDSFGHDERVKHLQHVYCETAKHFAQPIQQQTLKAEPKRLTAVMRISVLVTVYCWVKVSPQVMVAISIYFVHIVLFDDSTIDPGPDMASFFQDLLDGKQQKHPFWRLMNGHLSDLLQHYGSFCGLNILRSTFDYFQGYWIETHEFQGYPGSCYYPQFLRRLNGLGGICGATLFPAEDFNERALFKEVTSTIAQIEPMVTFVNDLISFYKEYDNPRDQVSLVTNYCQVEGISMDQAFDRVTEDAIFSCEQLLNLFDDGQAPAVADSIRHFVHGYITWHLCDERYRMREVYERSGESPDGMKFREYYESATKVGSIDFKEWAVSPSMVHGFNNEDRSVPYVNPTTHKSAGSI